MCLLTFKIIFLFLRLLEEKARVEQSLQQEMERKLEEKDKTLEEKLRQEKENLDRVIEEKETEQKFLISELDDFKEDNEKQKIDALKAKEAILSGFADLLETEMQCGICNELFIKVCGCFLCLFMLVACNISKRQLNFFSQYF